MPIRVGFLGVAHMHARSYVAALKVNRRAEISGVWDCDGERRNVFASKSDSYEASSAEDLFSRSDAVIICSPNRSHAEDAELAAAAGKPMLCEKPLVTSEEEMQRIARALENSSVFLMTAFPCRYAPSYERLRERVRNGDIGAIQAICATNRGRCPFDWFVDVAQSGGGAMIDHTVHVADLLRDLLGEEPLSVLAQAGNNMHGQEWEDTAMLTLQYPSGVFATIDSSWSRPKEYRTWGDVTMNVVGDKGVIELDLFAQDVQVYGAGSPSHTVAGYGSNLDAIMVDHFLECVEGKAKPRTTMLDGVQAARVALAGYRSLSTGEPVPLGV